MFHVIPPAEQQLGSNGTIAFEGKPYGGEVSFFLVNVAPGEGPALHTHPYSETWIVRGGEAAMTVGQRKLTATTGDIIVVNAETPHCFRNVGSGRLDMICIHASDHFIQRWVPVEI